MVVVVVFSFTASDDAKAMVIDNKISLEGAQACCFASIV
jgi:Flp pilus assembly protein protease CpaA